MKFNDVVKLLLEENVQVSDKMLAEFARIADHERLEGNVDPNYDKEAVKAALVKWFKEKPKGMFGKVFNKNRDLDIGSIFTSAIDETIAKLSLDSTYGLKDALFNFHGHNNNVSQNVLAQEVWKKINEELGQEIPKTKIKSTLLQVKGFMKSNSDLFLSTEIESSTKAGSSNKQTGKVQDSKNYKVIKDISSTEVQETITDQFDRMVARASKMLGQGEVVPIEEIKSLFDSFEYDALTIVKFFVDQGIIEPTNEILGDDEEDEKETKSSDDKEVKDLDIDFFHQSSNDLPSDVSSNISSTLGADRDFEASNW